MPLSEHALKQMWIENNLIQKKKNGELEFQGATQQLVNKAYYRNKQLNLNLSDVMEVALEQAVKTVFRFKIKDSPVDWDGLLQGDKDQNHKLWKAINLAVEFRLKNIDPWAKRSYENATKTDVIIKPKVTSLDQPKTDGTSWLESLSDDNRLGHVFEEKSDKRLAHWLETQGEKWLSKKQREYICSYKEGNFSDRNGYLPRIRKRLKQADGIPVNEELKEKIAILKEFQAILEDGAEVENQNNCLGDWIKNHLELEWLEDCLMENLGATQYRRLRKSDFPSSLLYRAAEALEKKLLLLEQRISESEKDIPIKKSAPPLRTFPPKATSKTKRKTLLPTGVLIDESE